MSEEQPPAERETKTQRIIVILKKFIHMPITIIIAIFAAITFAINVEAAAKFVGSVYSGFWDAFLTGYEETRERTLVEDLITMHFPGACPTISARLDLERTGRPEYLFVSFVGQKQNDGNRPTTTQKGCKAWKFNSHTQGVVFKRGPATFFGTKTGLRPTEDPKGIWNSGPSSAYSVIRTFNNSKGADASFFDIRGNWILLLSSSEGGGSTMAVLGWRNDSISFVPKPGTEQPLNFSWKWGGYLQTRLVSDNLRIRDDNGYHEIFFDRFTRASQVRQIPLDSMAPKDGLTRRLEVGLDDKARLIQATLDSKLVDQCNLSETWDKSLECVMKITLGQNDAISVPGGCKAAGFSPIPNTLDEYRVSYQSKNPHIKCRPRGPRSDETDVARIDVK